MTGQSLTLSEIKEKGNVAFYTRKSIVNVTFHLCHFCTKFKLKLRLLELINQSCLTFTAGCHISALNLPLVDTRVTVFSPAPLHLHNGLSQLPKGGLMITLHRTHGAVLTDVKHKLLTVCSGWEAPTRLSR